MAANAQGKYEQQIAQENVKAERAAAADARRRGEIEEQRRYRLMSQQIGQNTAAFAANGLEVDFGSPADVISDARTIGYEDVQTIRDNTKREIEGYDISAANYTMQGRASRARGKAALVGGVLQGASTLLGAASRFGGPGAGSTSSGGGFAPQTNIQTRSIGTLR